MKERNMSRQSVLLLMERKDAIENEIRTLNELLKSQKNVGMHESVLDSEGYPRSDIDVYQVRHARHRIICLQNDHKKLMKDIEAGLHVLHAQDRNKLLENNNMDTSESPSPQQIRIPFAKIEGVLAGSPAQQAGIVSGDQILQFGSVSKQNFQSVQNIAVVVQHSVGKPINVSLLRDNKVVSVCLIPNTWRGKGLLGCTIIPLME